MCVVAVFYTKRLGWIGAKNRDRNYKTEIGIIKSSRNDIQRLYIDDKFSRWTEGLNEFGICILSSALSVKEDEQEAAEVAVSVSQKRSDPNFYSPAGKTIRDALFESDIKKAIAVIVDNKLPGCTYVFNQDQCFLIESCWTCTKDKARKEKIKREFAYKIEEIKKEDKYSLRTNHSISLPGYGYDPENWPKEFESSTKRFDAVEVGLKKGLSVPSDLIDILAQCPNKNNYHNPIRLGDVSKSEMATTGQILLCPKDRTLHYRPICCSVEFSYDKINHKEAKVFFEIISDRKMLTFKEFEIKLSSKKLFEQYIQTINSHKGLNKSRDELPQLKDVAEFVEYCKSTGTRVTKKFVRAFELIPSQDVIDFRKVSDIVNNYQHNAEMEPLGIDKNNHIIDGHHRWTAIMYLNPGMEIPVYQFNMTVDNIVGKKFKGYA